LFTCALYPLIITYQAILSSYTNLLFFRVCFLFIPLFTSSLHRDFSSRLAVIDFTHQIYLAIYHPEYHHIFLPFSYHLRPTYLLSHAIYSISIILTTIIIIYPSPLTTFQPFFHITAYLSLLISTSTHLLSCLLTSY
jgi:hypothetical protein